MRNATEKVRRRPELQQRLQGGPLVIRAPLAEAYARGSSPTASDQPEHRRDDDHPENRMNENAEQRSDNDNDDCNYNVKKHKETVAVRPIV